MTAADPLDGLNHNLRPMRIVGRRPDGKALVELMTAHLDGRPRTPTGAYRTVPAHELRAPSVLPAQIRAHVERAPLIRFATDDPSPDANGIRLPRGGGDRPRGPLHAHHTVPVD